MAFDTNAPTPKVLFSPVGAVSEEDLAVIAAQSKSAAAESAIKMNVFQVDSDNEATNSHRRPIMPEAEVAVEEAESEEVAPVKRETKAAAPSSAKASDISDVVKKWSKK